MNRNAKFLQTKSHSHTVRLVATMYDGDHYEVVSGASGKRYEVTVSENGRHATCDCSWGQYRKTGASCACSHAVAVAAYRAGEAGRTVSAWASEEAAKRQHRPTVDVGDGLLLTTRRVAA